MQYGELKHRDIAVIRNTLGTSVARYNDWDDGDFTMSGVEEELEERRTDYFSFFGTEITVAAEDVELVSKLEIDLT